MKRIAFILLILFSVTACETYTASRYHVPAKHTYYLQNLNKNVNFSVGNFDQTDKVSVNRACRLAGPVKVTGDQTFADYLKDALIEEFATADIYSESSKKQLSGKIINASFSSVTPAYWVFNTDFSIDGSKDVINVNTNYSFGTSFSAIGACRNVAEAFPHAVEQHINDLFKNEAFKKAMMKKLKLSYIILITDLIQNNRLYKRRFYSTFVAIHNICILDPKY